jgi:phage terminase large subunit-like protein|tara:strand:- start:30614 stop:31888 length:1275 start_codon:yes stop_codon:yes gene_type:complete
MTQFTRTPKQIEATKVFTGHFYTMFFGGSRSGKTFLAMRLLVMRAIKLKSRHLAVRLRFNHIKQSVILDTFPKMMEICFPDLPYTLNKSDWYVKFANGSEIWFGGLDDKERVEKILGNEYSTIFLNESSQMDYDAVTTVVTRLAENSGLKPRMLFDCNPAGKKHWTYQQFILGISPETKEPLHDFDNMYGSIMMNPTDNLDNLPPHYVETLKGLPLRKRQRFLDGQFLNDVAGALWTDDMCERAKLRKRGDIVKTIVSVDPSVSSNANSDECGVGVCGLDHRKNGWVMEDKTAVMSPERWAQTAVNLYHKHDCDYIVAEKNQGGDLVRLAIHTVDPTIKVKLVHASKSKFARAEPVTVFYEEREESKDKRYIGHYDNLDELEEEMCSWIPDKSKESPNRIDWLTWGMTDLMLQQTQEIRIYIPD